MNVAVLGSGGREHSICYKLSQSKKIRRLFCIPGNAGTASYAININADTSNFKQLYNLIKKHNIKMIIVGPEQPLVEGIVDYFSLKGIKIFGPDKFCSKLEGSKYFTKKICKENNIPTAQFGFFNNLKKSKKFINTSKIPLVIKADGLAAGKGVYICNSKQKALFAVKEILSGKFKTSSKVLIEEFLNGEEMSYFIISDGKNYNFFGSAQDHKRVGENDKGPNTGGMGSYSPSTIINKKLENKILNKIVEPTLKALKKNNHPYKGILYVGLMILKNEPYLIEYNVRMGDPECQAIMARLKTDLFEIIDACINQKLKKIKIKWKKEKSMCIVLCSNGYPGIYKKNILIKNINKIKTKNNELIFHAGTIKIKNQIYSNGGRVLNFISLSKQLIKSRNNIINLIKKLNWKYGFYRKDIGWRAIKQKKL